MRKKEKRKGSIQSPKDLGIALGTFGVALVVITMITTPVFTTTGNAEVNTGVVIMVITTKATPNVPNAIPKSFGD